MDFTELKKQWLAEEQASFKGWDFSHIRGRWMDEQLPWDYEQLLRRYLSCEHQLLDMGTGGGEFLLSLNHPYSQCSVTEGYEPNVQLCKERLEPLGITVRKIENPLHIPYPDASFDLVINRHEAYDFKEVYRILKPGGTFITQQVGGKNDDDLVAKLGCVKELPDPKTFDLQNAMHYALQASFNVELGYEAFTPIEFYDVGAFVYFAHIIEWEFGGFQVESHFDQLCTLAQELAEHGCIRGSEHRYLLVLKK
ncbi:class I SAM-dependent methyltransferase [Dielma fastidiosa]|uniref:Methyltransferase family protein n=1 Tax=Dielma fastidiosa TaxID=1034346 RepID=A0A318KV40_9FIRM|nr:class I SAM-dependent methyltransferase [Dielma fastidiosa]PXX81489.1 methyltransferase family protein [Dielma fastidiosa]